MSSKAKRRIACCKLKDFSIPCLVSREKLMEAGNISIFLEALIMHEQVRKD